MKDENKDLKRAFNSQNTELANLKKRDVQLEKNNTKLEADRVEKDKAIRSLMEINDELVRKMKKDPNNAALQNSKSLKNLLINKNKFCLKRKRSNKIFKLEKLLLVLHPKLLEQIDLGILLQLHHY